MNCSVFRKKLQDYIEDTISNDLKQAMERHLYQCESCSALYEAEMSIENAFEEAFSLEGVRFSSSRNNIMNSIDKNKYKNKPMRKVYYHIARCRKQYLSVAVAGLLILVGVPKAVQYLGSGNQIKESAQIEDKIAKKDTSQKEIVNFDKAMEGEQTKESDDVKVMESEITREASKIGVILQKKSVDINTKIEFAIPWQPSPSKKYTATVEGRGAEAIEEVIGVLYVKEVEKNILNAYTIQDNQSQLSPKKVMWWDDTHLFVTIGNAHGTISPSGGNLYMLDISTGELSLVYDATSQNQSVTVMNKAGQDIELSIEVFEDEALNKSHIEKGVIKNYNLTLPKEIEMHKKEGVTVVPINQTVKME